MASYPISEYHDDRDASYPHPSQGMEFERADSLFDITTENMEELMHAELDWNVSHTFHGNFESYVEPGVNACSQVPSEPQSCGSIQWGEPQLTRMTQVQIPSLNGDQESWASSVASEQAQTRDTNSEQSLAVENTQASTLEQAHMTLSNNDQNHEMSYGSMMPRLPLTATNPPSWPNTEAYDARVNSLPMVPATRADPQSIQSEMPSIRLDPAQNVFRAAEMPSIGHNSSVQPRPERSGAPQAQMTVNYEPILQNEAEAYPPNGFRDESNHQVDFDNIDPNLYLVSTAERPLLASGPPVQAQTGASFHGVSQSLRYRAPQSQTLAHHSSPQQDFPLKHDMHQATTPLMSQSWGVEHLQTRSDYRYPSSVVTSHAIPMLQNNPRAQFPYGMNHVPNNVPGSNLQSSTNNGMRENISKLGCPSEPFCPIHQSLRLVRKMPEEWWPLPDKLPQSSSNMSMSKQPQARRGRPVSHSRMRQQVTTALQKSSQTRRSTPSDLNQTPNNSQGSASNIFTAAMLKDVSMSMPTGTSPPTPSSLRLSSQSSPGPPLSGSMGTFLRRTSQKNPPTNFGQFYATQDPNRYSPPDVPPFPDIRPEARPDSWLPQSNRSSQTTNMSLLDMGTEREMTGYFVMNTDTAPARLMPQGSYRPLMTGHPETSSAPFIYHIPKGPQKSSLRALKKQPSTNNTVRKPRTKKQAS